MWDALWELLYIPAEGSFRRSAGRIGVTAQLVQTRDRTQLWAETYERPKRLIY